MSNSEKEKAVWKTYPGIDFLQANQFGEIRTLDHYIVRKNGRKYFAKGRVLKQFDNGTSYLRVHVRVNGKQVNLLVHIIVASCFLPNPDSLPEINHKDNDPTNNKANNLEWCDHEYNISYREKYGKSAKESAKVLRKPLFAVNLETEEVLQFPSQSEAARQLGVNVGNINSVLKGRYKQAGGFWFCYADEHAVENIRAKFGDEVADKVKEQEKIFLENC